MPSHDSNFQLCSIQFRLNFYTFLNLAFHVFSLYEYLSYVISNPFIHLDGIFRPSLLLLSDKVVRGNIFEENYLKIRLPPLEVFFNFILLVHHKSKMMI